MRIYLDTNVVISAMLFPKGKSALVFEHVIKKHTAIISDYTISECKEVFEKKFPDKMEILNSLLTVFQPLPILSIFIGTLVGIIIGALPA